MDTLFLLHGAIGASDQMTPLSNQLSESFKVRTLNFSGHGGRPFAGDFSIAQFASELINEIEFLPENEKPVAVFGYSMGGYVAMYASLLNPHLFSGIITLATKWLWDEGTALKEGLLLNPEEIAIKLPAFAKKLEERHAPNPWKTVLKKTALMLTGMGKQPPIDFSNTIALKVPALLLAGDRDKTVTAEETIKIYRLLPQGALGIIPKTIHPIEKVDHKILGELITQFLQATK